MTEFIHQRHKPPVELERPRQLVVVCPPLRSNVNLSRIVRAAGCCGVRKMIACGNPKIDRKIARDGADEVNIEVRRTLMPALRSLKKDGFQLVGLEQTTDSQNIHAFEFQRKTALIVGHERKGLDDEVLGLVDAVIEIPVYGLPYSYNVATATSMVLYEYCRQFPKG